MLHRDSSTISLLASRVCDLLSGVRRTLRDTPQDSEQVLREFEEIASAHQTMAITCSESERLAAGNARVVRPHLLAERTLRCS
jgi:hypothetical protein